MWNDEKSIFGSYSDIFSQNLFDLILTDIHGWRLLRSAMGGSPLKSTREYDGRIPVSLFLFVRFEWPMNIIDRLDMIIQYKSEQN